MINHSRIFGSGRCNPSQIWEYCYV